MDTTPRPDSDPAVISAPPDSVTIKGTAGGLLVRLHDEADFGAVVGRLAERLAQGENFFRGARATLDTGRREADTAALEQVRGVLQQYDIRLENVISGANATRAAARKLGLNVKFGSAAPPPVVPVNAVGPATDVIERRATGSPAPELGEAFDTAEALFVRRTLRSGQRIQHHSDVVVIGDVNPGAEIVAGGSVLVWGALRGVVHAGALGDQKAVVGALLLNPTQLRIADRVARAPSTADTQNYGGPSGGPELAQVVGGRITVEAWTPGPRRR